MAKKDIYTVRNKVTGFTFELTKEVCDNLILEEPYNFEVLDKDYIHPSEKAAEEQTTYNQVIVEDKTTKENDLEAKTVQELKKLCDENKIEYDKKAKKADLIKLLEDLKTLAEDEVVVSDTENTTIEAQVIAEDEATKDEVAE